MLAKLLVKLSDERTMKRFSLALLAALLVFMVVMENRQTQAMLASYCDRVNAGQEDDWRGRLGYQCEVAKP